MVWATTRLGRPQSSAWIVSNNKVPGVSDHMRAATSDRVVWFKGVLHDTIRSCGALRLPVHRPIVTCGVLVECSGPMKIGWLGIRSRYILQPILSHLLCDYPIRAHWPFKSTFTSFNHDGEDGLRVWMQRKAPMLLRDSCVSYNMELFCRTNITPRNALSVMLDCNNNNNNNFIYAPDSEVKLRSVVLTITITYSKTSRV